MLFPNSTGAPGPYVAVCKTSQVLIGAGEKPKMFARWRAEGGDLFFRCRYASARPAPARKSLLLLTGKVAKSPFNRPGMRRGYRSFSRIEHQESFAEILQPR